MRRVRLRGGVCGGRFGQLQEDILQAHGLGAQGQHRAAGLGQRQRQRAAQVGAGLADGGKADLAAFFGGDAQVAEARHRRGGGQYGLTAALRRGRDGAPGGQAAGEFFRRALRDEFAVRDDEHAVADGLYLAEDMAGQNDGVRLAQVVDEGADLDHLRRVQADGRLVQDDDLGRAQQRRRNADALAVAFRQVADEPPLHTLQPGAGRGFFYRRSAGGLFALALELRHKQQVFLHGHVLVERRLFRQVTDARLGLHRLGGDVVPVHLHGAGRGRQIPRDDVHGGGFARAVGAQQAVDAAILHGEADIIHRDVAAVTLCQMFDFDQSGTPSPFSCIVTAGAAPAPGQVPPAPAYGCYYTGKL